MIAYVQYGCVRVFIFIAFRVESERFVLGSSLSPKSLGLLQVPRTSQNSPPTPPTDQSRNFSTEIPVLTLPLLLRAVPSPPHRPLRPSARVLLLRRRRYYYYTITTTAYRTARAIRVPLYTDATIYYVQLPYTRIICVRTIAYNPVYLDLPLTSSRRRLLLSGSITLYRATRQRRGLIISYRGILLFRRILFAPL